MKHATALVAGATGLIGSHLLTLLLASARHEQVIALTRQPLDFTHHKLTNLVVDFNVLEEEMSNANIHVDEAYCALGSTIKKAGSQEAFRKVDFDYETAFARAAQQAGATRFGLVSSVGANAKSPIFYTRVKGETENAIRAMAFPALHIFQPGVLVGARGEVRPAEHLAITLTPLLNLGLLGPMRKYRGISAEIVARAMVAILATDGPGGTHLYDDMVTAAAL